MNAVLNSVVLPEENLTLSLNCITNAYGTLIFDALRAFRGRDDKLRFHRLEEHHKRFNLGLSYFGFPDFYSLKQLKEGLDLLMGSNNIGTDCYVKLVAFWPDHSTSASLFNLADYRPSVALTVNPCLQPFDGRPISLALYNGCRNVFPFPSHIKSSANYYHVRVPLHEAHKAGYNNLLYHNELVKIQECVDSAIFFVAGDRLHSPTLATGILPSVTRAAIIEVAAEIGIDTAERFISVDEICHFDFAFVCNTAYLMRPVSRIDKMHFAQDCSLYSSVMSAYKSHLRSNASSGTRKEAAADLDADGSW